MRRLKLFLLGLFLPIAYVGTIFFSKEIITYYSLNNQRNEIIKNVQKETGAILGVSVKKTNFFKEYLDDEKRIYVDLSTQKLYAYKGGTKVYEFTISSGKRNRTPTGIFRIWIKFDKKDMSGGSAEAGTFYDLKDVPHVMFFYNSKYPKWDGYGIHGAYWHDGFGVPESYGCINMEPNEAKLLFDWAEPKFIGREISQSFQGTEVIIYGHSPKK